MHTRIAPAVALALAALVLATPAEAQLGGLGKKLKKAVGQQATEAAGVETGPTAPPPRFDSRTLEITERHLNGFLTDAREEAAARKANKAKLAAAKKAYADSMKVYEKQRAAYEKQEAAYNACVEKAQPGLDAANDKADKATEKFEAEVSDAKLAEMEKRAEAAQKAGNNAEAMRIYNEMQAIMQRTGLNDAMQAGAAAGAAAAKCAKLQPTPPKEPKDPTEAALDLKRAGVKGLGLTAEQLAIMEDRLYTLMGVKDRKAFDGWLTYGFSKQEQQALTAVGWDLVLARQEVEQLKYDR